MYIVMSYLAYLAISVGVTIWVAQTLQHNGRVFLRDAFPGDAALADSVNRLLVVGFYLINIGYVALALRTSTTLTDSRQAIELVCDKMGVVLLVLGTMHFFNLYIFNRLRRRGSSDKVRIGFDRLPHGPEAGWAPAGAPAGKILD